MQKLKSLILYGIIILAGIATVAFAAPSWTYQRTILPETDNSYELGTTSSKWRNIFTNQICLSGTCQTQWPDGVGGATTTNPLMATYFVATSSTATSTFAGGIKADSLQVNNMTSDYIAVATTSGQIAPYLPVDWSDRPIKNDLAYWNGSKIVWAPSGTTFTFSVATFSDGESTTPQLIGLGTWKAISSMSYTASYNNGPPTTADVKLSINGGAYSTIGTMTASTYTTGTNSGSAISYPPAKDQTLRFELVASDGTDSSTKTDTAITFNNYIYRGASATASGLTEANVEALTGTISSTYTGSNTFSSGVGTYMVLAFPASYTSVPASLDYETSGGTGFLFNSIAAAFTLDSSTLSITNSAGFVENYKVYVANTSNLGSGTLSVSTSAQTIDKLYYGITTTASGYTQTDVKGLANNSITNDNTQVWSSVTAGTGEYLLFAFPKRLGTVTFYVSGFAGGFQSPETVSVTNANGFTEDYYVWRSTNSGLGATIVETR